MEKIKIRFIVILCLLISIPSNVLSEEIELEEGLRSEFNQSFIKSCQESITKSAINNFIMLTGISNKEQISPLVRTKIEEISKPLYASCNCMVKKNTVTVASRTDQHIEINLNLLSQDHYKECAPTETAQIEIKNKFNRLLVLQPPVPATIRTKREPFSLKLPVHNGFLALFASLERPVLEFGRLVFLSPGTGRACSHQNLCVDNSGLKVISAADFPEKWLQIIGPEGKKNFQEIIKEVGAEASFITSGHTVINFTLREKPGILEYRIERIGGVPVKSTKVNKLWLVVFDCKPKANPRAVTFIPAIASVIEIEFIDGA